MAEMIYDDDGNDDLRLLRSILWAAPFCLLVWVLVLWWLR